MEELSFVNKKGGTELTEITTKVEIADRTGHTTLQLTQSETLERVSVFDTHWMLPTDRIVQSHELAEANWETVGTIWIIPALVGGDWDDKTN